MKQSDSDDHPRYDDLIRELHELKRFIETHGEYSPAQNLPGSTSEPQVMSNTPGPVTSAVAAPSPPVDNTEDAPPVLRQVVRRNPPDDAGQLDLLAATAGTRESAAQHQNPIEAPRSESGLDEQDSLDFQTAQTTVDRSVARVTGDDEVLEFVYDLADRILATIEDKLLERSGELLADDLRGELRESIGDMLYEWCER